ncbi:MAG: hypothetical protein ABIF77_17620 [bacterium]
MNHAYHWNPNFEQAREMWSIEPVGVGEIAAVLPLVLAQLELIEPVPDRWRAGVACFLGLGFFLPIVYLVVEYCRA